MIGFCLIMNNIKFTMNGFKCFDEKKTFDLNRLTLLTGANSGGKSSVIQALLLTKKAAYSNNSEISLADKEFALDLGGFSDIASRDSISFEIDGKQWMIRIEDNDDDGEIIKFRTEHADELRKIFSTDFSFLAADRDAPSYQYSYKGKGDLCNCHGSNMGDVYNKHEYDNVTSNRSLKGNENKLKPLLNDWVDYIFPDVKLIIKNAGDNMYKIVDHDKFAATNIGFGITYALPILINGLLVKDGGWLIVENPEAHLHPKAQSNMGYFLACIASAGVRVIVETHSEHIVNGIRRFVLKQDTELKASDIAIYFFKKDSKEKNIEKIDVDKEGNLSKLPVDFFDQVRQDMHEIIQLGIEKSQNNHD